MSGIRVDQKIIAMSAGLRLKGDDPVEAISEHCRRLVAKLLKGVRDLRAIADVENVICDKLNLTIHEIWNDDDLKLFSAKYASEGAGQIAALDMDLEGEQAFGVIYQRNAWDEAGERCYVAFVDCRGKKAHRRFFTRWHEIAHRLTIFNQFEMSFRRVHGEDIAKEPLEQLMDKIAGEIGFWNPLFLPVLETQIGDGPLTFEAVESVRVEFCFDASNQSTLNACAARLTRPTVVIEVGLEYKVSEKRMLDLLGNGAPSSIKPSLRVLRSMPNQAARHAGMLIHKKRRIPASSIISKVHVAEPGEMLGPARENLSDWVASNGGSLGDFNVVIDCRKIGGRVLAIISLAE